MRRLLIIGCGDVVRRVLPDLVRRWRVMVLVREKDAALATLGVVQLCGDLDDFRSLRRLAGIAEAVIHSAPPADDAAGDPRTRRLLAVLRQGKSLPRSLAYISTSGVYGDCQGEATPETRPLNTGSSRALRRVAAENLLRRFGYWGRSGCRVSLLRAPGIYAADRLPLDRVRRGDPALNPESDVHTNHIHALDLGRACLAALRRGRPNRSYNINDDSGLKMGDWFDRVADAFGLPRPPRVDRAEAEKRLSPAMLSFMSESRRLVNRRLKQELQLRLLYPTVNEGIAEALEKKS